ncbi:uncharacterized protein [Dysidea avara]|uniref:uncharacterized protein n=1 Tax=Dysidea avara TaxID=196820 RepID=UPI00333183FA
MDDLIEEVDFEDDHQCPNLISALKAILLQYFTTLLWLTISVPCLPFFVLGLFIWGLPPIIPPWSTFYRCFMAVFTEGKPKENIPVTNRVLLFLILLASLIKVPVNGVCWYIDELVCSSYHKVNIEEPVFMITAPRSGSSQLCDYLEKDSNNFITPVLAEGMFPYVWVWKLFVPLLVKTGMQKKLQNYNLFGKEATKHHALVISKSETWDSILQFWYLGICYTYLGSSFMCWAWLYTRFDRPMNEDYFRNFVPFTSCVMKKVMYYRGKPNQRMLVKGHFLGCAKPLEQHYPKGKIFVVVRNPLDRLSSFINLAKVMGEDGPAKLQFGLFAATLRTIRSYTLQTQIPYCEQEMLFYKEPADNKLVIPFTMYVNNLSATLQHIYSFCDIPIPDDVMSNAVRIQCTTHDYTKVKASYAPKFNRTLASLGVNEKKLREKLSEYIEWMNGLESSEKIDS